VENKKRILIVDDDQNIANLLRTVLSRTYAVECCYSLGEALELFDANQYNLIITDLELNGESGLTLARYVREQKPSIEVIVVTGHASIDSYREAADLGVISYLTKPIKIDKLKLLVKRSILSHSFNEKSQRFTDDKTVINSDHHSHMVDILTLYNIVTKLNQTVELESTIRVLLKELTQLHNADIVVLGVNTLGFQELFTNSKEEAHCSDESIRNILCNAPNSEIASCGIPLEDIEYGDVPITFINGEANKNDGKMIPAGTPFVLPLNSYGEDFGFIALYREDGSSLTEDREEFYFALAPLLAPPIYRGFIARKTQAQAQTDGLTGIANRRSLQKTIHRDIQRAVRHDQPLSILMMDIDNFKKVNDTFGHLMGDAVLKELTTVVNSIIRGSDFFGRYGGEEFIVVLPDTEHDGAMLLAERIRHVIEEKICNYDGESISYTVSIGVAIFNAADVAIGTPIDWKSCEESFLSRVDSALYKAKRSGKNCVVVAE